MKELLIIPLIGLVLWVLTYLLRSSTQERSSERGRPTPPNRPRKGPSDLDRYLAQQQQRPNEPTATRPVPTAQGRTTRPGSSRPPAGQRRRSGREEAPVILQVIPEEPKQSLAQRLDAPKAPPSQPSPPPPLAPPSPIDGGLPALTIPAATVTTANRSQGVILSEIARLMNSPASLRAAFVLNEVLGPPLSRRNGRNGPQG